jgi:hypothetical protein
MRNVDLPACLSIHKNGKIAIFRFRHNAKFATAVAVHFLSWRDLILCQVKIWKALMQPALCLLCRSYLFGYESKVSEPSWTQTPLRRYAAWHSAICAQLDVVTVVTVVTVVSV